MTTSFKELLGSCPKRRPKQDSTNYVSSYLRVQSNPIIIRKKSQAYSNLKDIVENDPSSLARMKNIKQNTANIKISNKEGR